jgi:hypothetical protein
VKLQERERPSYFRVWKTLFHVVLTVTVIVKIERVVIVRSYNEFNKSIEQIYKSLINLALPSKHATIYFIDVLEN